MRLYVRVSVVKFFGREDWLTVAAMVVFTTFCSLCLRATVYGLGAHMYNISPGSLVTGFKIIFICELLYVVSTTVTKLSVAAFYLRLANKKYQRVIIYANVAFVLIFSSMYFFFLLFQCAPINYLWTKYEDGHGKCLHDPILSSVTYAHCAMSALTDWVFGILPIFFVWKMRMNPRTKLSVVLILSLGFFASTATIVRIVYIKSLTRTTDYSWEGINLVKWSMVEPAIAITAMNIATLRPMFKNFFVAAKKRFDPSTDSEGSIGPLGDLKVELISERNSVGVNEYSAEFATLLGLTRVGVTTEISAGSSEKSPTRKRFTLNRTVSRISEYKAESQTELNGMPSPQPSINDMSWAAGIKTTTVIMQERS